MRQINSKGFTLIELLVVIAIIGVLATMSIVAVNLARNKAKIAKAQNDIDEIYKAIASMGNDTNSWPGHQNIGEVCTSGCAAKNICDEALCTADLSDPSSGIVANDTFAGWNGPYMNAIPLDPWDHEYFFNTSYSVKIADNTPCNDDLQCYDVVVVGSNGPDGIEQPIASPQTLGADDIIKIIK